MKLIFWRKHKREKIAAIEKETASIHRNNIDKIVASRENVNQLKTVLAQNNITLELAKAMGHQ